MLAHTPKHAPHRLLMFILLTLTACGAPAPATPSALPATTVANTATPASSAIASPAVSGTRPPFALPQTDWIGALTAADGTLTPVLVQLTDNGGTLTVQPQTATLALSAPVRDDVHITFQTTDKAAWQFAGTFDGSRITGNVTRDGQTGAFTLRPLLALDADALATFAGVYQFDTGESMKVHLPFNYDAGGLAYFWSGLTLTHFGTGAVRGLYPIAEDTFLVGSARVLGAPFAAQITFARDAHGTVTGLMWQALDAQSGALETGTAQHATRITLPEETVRYASADGIHLTGLLTLPALPGTHPAIVVIHGSERGLRADFFRQQLSAFMASHGIAVLTYDKRGVGDSEGTYQEAANEANLQRLAQDALAGVAYLKSRPEIDGAHIGLIGSSQGGWIIPLAAAQSTDVACFVVLSGPTVSVGIEDAYSEYTNDGESPPVLTSAEISAKLARLSPSGFDPVPVLAQVERPGLWLWGDEDKSIPIPESVASLEALIAQGHTTFSYTRFPQADHNLQQTTQGLFNELPYSHGYPETLFARLGEWLATACAR